MGAVWGWGEKVCRLCVFRKDGTGRHRHRERVNRRRKMWRTRRKSPEQRKTETAPPCRVAQSWEQGLQRGCRGLPVPQGHLLSISTLGPHSSRGHSLSDSPHQEADMLGKDRRTGVKPGLSSLIAACLLFQSTLCDMEDRAGQAASWLHWDLLSHESSFRTQGIHANQVMTPRVRWVDYLQNLKITACFFWVVKLEGFFLIVRSSGGFNLVSHLAVQV